jgi:hypothetical protein
MRAAFLFLLLLLLPPAHAQWQILDSNTTADLRGIDNVGRGVVWASGSNGTILRSEDAGFEWQHCAIPPNAEHLDFRGIQAFDNNTAIVMSSGKGSLSRLYKTTDGCQTWKLVLNNPDTDGFWDAYVIGRSPTGLLLGDPVNDHIPIWRPNFDYAIPTLEPFRHLPRAKKGEAEFAASNSALFVSDAFFDFWIATGGISGSRVIKRVNHDFDSFGFDTYESSLVPVGSRTVSSGVFSLSFRKAPINADPEKQYLVGVAVGGDYLKPDDPFRTAAFTTDGSKTWQAATTPPHGYRSAVAYDAPTKTWITVGPNGTDISTDDGRNWRALKPGPNDAPDTDKNWNALSLPFVAGPHGRIGLLEPSALQPASH